jgi:hypothetical protein
MNDYVIDARFESFEVYASRPDMAYVLYHLPRSHAAPGEPRFLRVYPGGRWELVEDKTYAAQPVGGGQFRRAAAE